MRVCAAGGGAHTEGGGGCPWSFAWYKIVRVHYWLINFNTTSPVEDPSWSNNGCVM